MLKVLRDNLKFLSWILWLVIAVFVLFVFLDFGAATDPRNGPTQHAATVGDEQVTYDELQRAHRNLEQRVREVYGEQFTPEMLSQLGLDRMALEQLVDEKVKLLEARRLGLKVGDEEVREEVLRYFADAQGRFIGPEFYRQAVRNLGFRSPEEFENTVREQILVGKLERILAAGLYVTDADVERSYRDQVERASIRYLLLPSADLRGQATVAGDEMEAYLAAHGDDFRFPDRRRVAYLLVDNMKLRGQLTVSDEEVAAYYAGHPDEFTQEDQVRARHIQVMVNDERTVDQAKAVLAEARRRIEGGEDFAAVAREVSEDSLSAVRGGDLGLKSRGQQTPEFEAAAFAATPNTLVGPVETPFGVHLLEVTERRGAGTQAMTEVAPRIRNRLLGERVQAAAQAKAREIADRLRGQEPIDAAKLKAAAEAEPAAAYVESAPFGRDETIPGIGRVEAFSTAAFTLEKGALSEPTQIARGYALLTPIEELPARAPNLSEVEPRVRQAVALQKAQQLAMGRLATVKAEIAAGAKTFDQAAAELGLAVEDGGSFGATGAIRGLGVLPDLAKAAMAMEVGQVGGPFGNARGAALFEVTSRERFEPAVFAAARGDARRQIENQELDNLLAALVQQRRAEVGVRFDDRLADLFKPPAQADGRSGA